MCWRQPSKKRQVSGLSTTIPELHLTSSSYADHRSLRELFGSPLVYGSSPPPLVASEGNGKEFDVVIKKEIEENMGPTQIHFF